MRRRPASISSDPRVERALRGLGWKSPADPELWLQRHARTTIERSVNEAARSGIRVSGLDDVVRILADRLRVQFVEIEDDDTLERCVDDYCRRGELAFAALGEDMAGDVEGAIVRLKRPAPWEKPLVAVIDARGQRSAARYFCSCHEVSHTILEPQLEFSFRCRSAPGNLLEQAVDIVASEVAFFAPLAAPLLRRYAPSDLTYSAVDAFWRTSAPFASRTAAYLAAVNLWPRPAMLVTASERCAKHGRDGGVPALRVQDCLSNRLAREQGLFLPPYRVPAASAIYAAFEDRRVASHEHDEDLSWWESNGRSLPSRPVRVGARRVGPVVYAILRF